MSRPKKAASQHPPEPPSHSRHRRVDRASPQTRGRTQDLSPAWQDAPTPLLLHPAPRQALVRARQAPNLRESTAEVAAALHSARTATHRTKFRVHSSIRSEERRVGKKCK